MDYTKIFEAVIMLILAIVTTFVIPWLKANYTQKQLDTWMMWVRIAVTAAEQLFTAEQWSEKKQYVVTYLKDRGIKYNEATINNMIEAAVLELHLYMKEGNSDAPILVPSEEENSDEDEIP